MIRKTVYIVAAVYFVGDKVDLRQSRIIVDGQHPLTGEEAFRRCNKEMENQVRLANPGEKIRGCKWVSDSCAYDDPR